MGASDQQRDKPTASADKRTAARSAAPMKPSREERLAKALRDNLRRRKAAQDKQD
jgi:hypothetical protein